MEDTAIQPLPETQVVIEESEAVVNKKKPMKDQATTQKKVCVQNENIIGLSTDELLDRQCKDGKTSILGWVAMIWDDDYTFLHLYDHLKVLLRRTLIACNLTVKRFLFTMKQGVLKHTATPNTRHIHCSVSSTPC